MIQALAPAAYGLLAAAALPLLIHLLARRSARRQPFPAVMLLLRARGGGSRAVSRLRDWLALLLRTLAIVALALAVAGLVQRDQAAGGPRRPLVVVLDASASMRQRSSAGSAWQEARAVCDGLLRDASPRPVALLIAGQRIERSGNTVAADISPALALLGSAEPGYGAGSAARAVAEAASLLPDGGDLVVVSDLANRALAGIDPTGLPAGIHLRVVPVAGGAANRAVTRLGLRPGVAAVDRPVDLGIQVANHADTPAELTLEISAEGVRDQRTLRVEARSVGRLTHPLRFAAVGDQVVRVALVGGDGDALPEDDALDGIVPVRTGIAVAVVGDGDSGPRGALRPVLAALRGSGVRHRFLASATAEADPLPDEVLVSAGFSADSHFARAAAAYLDRGGCWLQIIDGASDVTLGKAVSDQHMPIALGDEFSTRGRAAGGLTIIQARLEHPLLAGFFGREVLLAQIEAYRVVLGTPATGAEVLLAFEDGTPALAERRVGAGRWWQLNCSPAEIRSNLAALDLMPLFIERLAAAVVPERALTLSVDCGGAVSAPRGISHLQRGAVLVDGLRASLPWPGLYRDADGRTIAAGIPEAESDLRPVAAGVLAALGVTAEGGGVVSGGGAPLWPWLLLGAASALMLELVVARPAPRSRP